MLPLVPVDLLVVHEHQGLPQRRVCSRCDLPRLHPRAREGLLCLEIRYLFRFSQIHVLPLFSLRYSRPDGPALQAAFVPALEAAQCNPHRLSFRDDGRQCPVRLVTNKAALTNWCGAKSGGTTGSYVNGPCTGTGGAWLGVTCGVVGGASRVTKIDMYNAGVTSIGGSLPTSWTR